MTGMGTTHPSMPFDLLCVRLRRIEKNRKRMLDLGLEKAAAAVALSTTRPPAKYAASLRSSHSIQATILFNLALRYRKVKRSDGPRRPTLPRPTECENWPPYLLLRSARSQKTTAAHTLCPQKRAS